MVRSHFLRFFCKNFFGKSENGQIYLSKSEKYSRLLVKYVTKRQYLHNVGSFQIHAFYVGLHDMLRVYIKKYIFGLMYISYVF